MIDRRKILKLFSTAPLAAGTLGKMETARAVETAKVMRQVGRDTAMSAGATPGNARWLIASNPKLLALFKAGLLPDWVKADMRDTLRESTRYLTTDVAALRSVSLSGKVFINHARAERAFEVDLINSLARDAMRHAFYNQHDERQNEPPDAF